MNSSMPGTSQPVVKIECPWEACKNWVVAQSVAVSMNCNHGKIPDNEVLDQETVISAIEGLFEPLSVKNPGTGTIDILCLQEWVHGERGLTECKERLEKKIGKSRWESVSQKEADGCMNVILYNLDTYTKQKIAMVVQDYEATIGENESSKRYVKVKLRHKETGNDVIVYSFHGRNNGINGREKETGVLEFLNHRYVEHCEWKDAISKNTPVLIGGDWNYEHRLLLGDLRDEKTREKYRGIQHARIWVPDTPSTCKNAEKKLDYFVVIDNWSVQERFRGSDDSSYSSNMLRLKDHGAFAATHETLKPHKRLLFDHDPVFAEFELHSWRESRKRNDGTILKFPRDCIHPENEWAFESDLEKSVEETDLIHCMVPFSAKGKPEEIKFRLAAWQRRILPKIEERDPKICDFSRSLEVIVKDLETYLSKKSESGDSAETINFRNKFRQHLNYMHHVKGYLSEDTAKLVLSDLKKWMNDNRASVISQGDLVDLINQRQREKGNQKQAKSDSFEHNLKQRFSHPDFNMEDFICNVIWKKAVEGIQKNDILSLDSLFLGRKTNRVALVGLGIKQYISNELGIHTHSITDSQVYQCIKNTISERVEDFRIKIPSDSKALKENIMGAVRNCLQEHLSDQEHVWSRISDNALLIYCQILFDQGPTVISGTSPNVTPLASDPSLGNSIEMAGPSSPEIQYRTPLVSVQSIKPSATNDSPGVSRSDGNKRMVLLQEDIQSIQKKFDFVTKEPCDHENGHFPEKSNLNENKKSALLKLHEGMGRHGKQKKMYFLNDRNIRNRITEKSIEEVLTKFDLWKEYQEFEATKKGAGSVHKYLNFIRSMIDETGYDYKEGSKRTKKEQAIKALTLGFAP